MWRILAFWTWTTEAAPAPLGTVTGGMLMVHGGYIRRTFRAKEISIG